MEDYVVAMEKRESLIVASKVKGLDMMTSSDAVKAISDKVNSLFDNAMAKTRASGRSTRGPQDL